MKPFRRVRPGRVLPASEIDPDTGRKVEKALDLPARSRFGEGRAATSDVDETHEFQALSELGFLIQARVTHNIQSWLHSKVLETCLPVSLPLLHPLIIEKLGEGKPFEVLDKTSEMW